MTEWVTLQYGSAERKAFAMHFRAATEADIPLLQDLARAIWREYYPSIIPPEQIEFMLEWMYSEKQIRKELGDGTVWEVLELPKGQAIGFLSLQLESDRRVKLNKLYLLPQFHGKGLANVALERVFEHVRSLGGNVVWMQVNKRNYRAVAAYRKAGFHIAREAVFDIGHGFVMDDYLMEKTVPPEGAAKGSRVSDT
jgi:diamine N-acetyltransferase